MRSMRLRSENVRKGIRMVWSVLYLTLWGYGLLVLMLFLFQTRLIFPRGGTFYQTPDALGWQYEDVVLQVDGETTHGWFVPAPESRGVVLFSHGNAGNIAHRFDSMTIFRSLGFDVLIYDYGGYGKSTGGPSETRCYQDIRAMWYYLTTDRGVSPDRIVLFGRSLGGAAAVDLATEIRPAGLILESCFFSVTQMAWETFPIAPMRLLVRHKLDNTAKIGRVACPVLFVHSPDDEIIPYRHGRELYERCNAPKTFLDIRGDHNGGFILSGNLYKRGLDDFLTSVFD